MSKFRLEKFTKLVSSQCVKEVKRYERTYKNDYLAIDFETVRTENGSVYIDLYGVSFYDKVLSISYYKDINTFTTTSMTNRAEWTYSMNDSHFNQKELSELISAIYKLGDNSLVERLDSIKTNY